MNIASKAKDVIGAVAPTLGMALGGPLGGMAGKFLSDALGVKPAEVSSIVQAGDPEQMVKVKEAEKAFEAKMAELDISLESLHQKDRSSARELAQNTSMVPQVTLGVIFVVGYFIIVMGLLTQMFTMPEDAATLVSGLIGVLTAGTIKVLDFFLGSSAGSKLKTVMGNGK